MSDQSRRGEWLMTFGGHPYWPIDPHPEDIFIADIAHALSLLCRYTGHVKHFYCVTPDTKILTQDFHWTPAGKIISGDMLWGFDEHAKGHRDLKKWRLGQAIVHPRIDREIIELFLSDGTVLACSSEHPLLSSTKLAGNQRWLTAEQIFNRVMHGSKNHPRATTYLPKFLSTWEEDRSYEAGWLAGMFDGEGSLSSKSSGSLILSIGQNPGETLEKIKRCLQKFGYDFGQSHSGIYKCQSLTIRGGLREQLGLLGTIRPERLIEKAIGRLAGRDLMRTGDLAEVVGAKRCGKGEVIALETSTHTYLTEGFGSHNSVAEHSILVSHMVPPELALEGLLHDASEAYCSDINKPLKTHMPEYKEIEALNSAAIRIRFGLPHTEHPEVKQADTDILISEYSALMPPLPVGFSWRWGGIARPNVKIYGFGPMQVEAMFLNRFDELGGKEQ